MPATAQRDPYLRVLGPRTKAAFGRAWLDWGGFSTTSADIAQPNLMRTNAKWETLIGTSGQNEITAEAAERGPTAEAEVEAEALAEMWQAGADEAPAQHQEPQSAEAGTEPRASNLRRAEWSVLDRLGSLRPTTVTPSASSRSQFDSQTEKQEMPASESSSSISEHPRAQTKREKILARARAVAKEPLPEHLIPGGDSRRPVSQEEKDETAPQAFLKSFAETFRDGSGFGGDVAKDEPRSAQPREGEEPVHGRMVNSDVDQTEAGQKETGARDEVSRKESDETLRKRLMKFVGLGG